MSFGFTEDVALERVKLGLDFAEELNVLSHGLLFFLGLFVLPLELELVLLSDDFLLLVHFVLHFSPDLPLPPHLVLLPVLLLHLLQVQLH